MCWTITPCSTLSIKKTVSASSPPSSTSAHGPPPTSQRLSRRLLRAPGARHSSLSSPASLGHLSQFLPSVTHQSPRAASPTSIDFIKLQRHSVTSMHYGLNTIIKHDSRHAWHTACRHDTRIGESSLRSESKIVYQYHHCWRFDLTFVIMLIPSRNINHSRTPVRRKATPNGLRSAMRSSPFREISLRHGKARRIMSR